MIGCSNLFGGGSQREGGNHPGLDPRRRGSALLPVLMIATLLTLSDSRLPAGGHAHSGGVEQAIAAGVVTDPGSLSTFLRRRLATAGSVAAGFAAAACAAAGDRKELT